ncbi:MAG: M15 family metallopeptidase [Oscillospiraceae bacterium]|nr:M15 family metallopeptidase [Oscillospiraceae bacterium]
MSRVPTQKSYETEADEENYAARRRSSSSTLLFLIIVLLLGVLLFLRYKGESKEDDTVLSSPSPDIVESAPPEETAEPETSPEPTIIERPWNLVLVNRDNSLEEGFEVPALTQLQNGHAIDSRAYQSLQDMMDAARADGLQPVICSSFRTWDKQDELFYNKVSSYLNQGYSQADAEDKAAFWVARPGTSEHQLGLAVDIVDINYQLLDENQESIAVQQWLIEHCMEYGFILRYPTSKSDITGVGYEPWHYRYVGIEAAKEISEQGICLEEYLQAVPCS